MRGKTHTAACFTMPACRLLPAAWCSEACPPPICPAHLTVPKLSDLQPAELRVRLSPKSETCRECEGPATCMSCPEAQVGNTMRACIHQTGSCCCCCLLK